MVSDVTCYDSNARTKLSRLTALSRPAALVQELYSTLPLSALLNKSHSRGKPRPGLENAFCTDLLETFRCASLIEIACKHGPHGPVPQLL